MEGFPEDVCLQFRREGWTKGVTGNHLFFFRKSKKQRGGSQPRAGRAGMSSPKAHQFPVHFEATFRWFQTLLTTGPVFPSKSLMQNPNVENRESRTALFKVRV